MRNQGGGQACVHVHFYSIPGHCGSGRPAAGMRQCRQRGRGCASVQGAAHGLRLGSTGQRGGNHAHAYAVAKTGSRQPRQTGGVWKNVTSWSVMAMNRSRHDPSMSFSCTRSSLTTCTMLTMHGGINHSLLRYQFLSTSAGADWQMRTIPLHAPCTACIPGQ